MTWAYPDSFKYRRGGYTAPGRTVFAQRGGTVSRERHSNVEMLAHQRENVSAELGAELDPTRG
jgi:hypothetical protein